MLQNLVFATYCTQDLAMRDSVNSEKLHLVTFLSNFPQEIDISGESFPRMNECQATSEKHNENNA